ncbi:hypothetical protein PGTUg99_018068 [Puccinia graminis f. sp. tritici]|nr:hypothetical protein PGTUg99_018068 [Puccinia graminis f. sp. tritici]
MTCVMDAVLLRVQREVGGVHGTRSVPNRTRCVRFRLSRQPPRHLTAGAKQSSYAVWRLNTKPASGPRLP